MATRHYRLTVISCALSWFLVGLHLPALHQMTHHGGALRWDVLAVTLLLAGAAVAGLWALLRGSAPRSASPGPGASAP